jgi:integrase
MRWGELVALERRDIDLKTCTIYVRRQAVELDGEPIFTGTPKSAAGVRDVVFPEEILPEVTYHLDTYVGSEQIAKFLGELIKEAKKPKEDPPDASAGTKKP